MCGTCVELIRSDVSSVPGKKVENKGNRGLILQYECDTTDIDSFTCMIVLQKNHADPWRGVLELTYLYVEYF